MKKDEMKRLTPAELEATLQDLDKWTRSTVTTLRRLVIYYHKHWQQSCRKVADQQQELTALRQEVQRLTSETPPQSKNHSN